MIYAGILAAGYGWEQRREEMPNQFMIIGSKPVMIHTLEQFVVNPYIDYIMIAAPENWIIYTQDLLRKYIETEKIMGVISGGNSKNESIEKIVKEIDSKFGIQNGDVLVNHDAIRPFVTQRIINENLENIKKFDSVDTAVPTIDTIIRADDRGQIEEITSKRIFYSEQTPQTFNLSKLKAVYDRKTEIPKYVNAIRYFKENGHNVQLVLGDYSNIKIVTPYDLEVANCILKDREHDK